MRSHKSLYLMTGLACIVLQMVACGGRQVVPTQVSPTTVTISSSPTSTVVPSTTPTPTPVPPTSTPAPPTSTPVPPTSTPVPQPTRDDALIEEVAIRSLEATKKMEWEIFAELMHPEALEDFKEMLVPILEMADEEGSSAQAIVALFEGIPDVESALALEPEEFLVRFFRGLMSQDPQIRQAFATINFKVIGTVREGEDLAHVVYWMGMRVEDINATQVAVVTLKRSGLEWKMMLRGEIRGLAEQLRRAFMDD